MVEMVLMAIVVASQMMAAAAAAAAAVFMVLQAAELTMLAMENVLVPAVSAGQIMAT